MGEDKLWVDLGGRPLLAYTFDAVAATAAFDTVVVAAPVARWEQLRVLAATTGIGAIDVVEGGESRQESVAAALARCVDAEWVCVHDAARPLAPPELFVAVLAAAREHGAATTGVPCVDTVKQVEDGRVVATLERAGLIATQTPQAFAGDVLRRAHRAAQEQSIKGDDDAYLVERLSATVAVVPGDVRNIKVTHPQDLILLRALLGVAV
jgi:2-C-methyl-D-erythritol 4-phosphate cytidylyltransferase